MSLLNKGVDLTPGPHLIEFKCHVDRSVPGVTGRYGLPPPVSPPCWIPCFASRLHTHILTHILIHTHTQRVLTNKWSVCGPWSCCSPAHRDPDPGELLVFYGERETERSQPTSAVGGCAWLSGYVCARVCACLPSGWIVDVQGKMNSCKRNKKGHFFLCLFFSLIRTWIISSGKNSIPRFRLFWYSGTSLVLCLWNGKQKNSLTLSGCRSVMDH